MSLEEEIYDRLKQSFRECLSARIEAANAMLEQTPRPQTYDEVMSQMQEFQFRNFMDYTDCILAAVSEELASRS